MTNLIPQSAKKKVTTSYWTRVISVWIFIISGMFIIFSVLLIPVNFIINSQIKIYTEPSETASKDNNEYGLSSAVLIKSSAKARLIMDLEKRQYFSQMVELIESLTNEGVTIESFALSQIEGEIAPIQITGQATTRLALADFRETLLSSKEIETVFLPISNLTRDKDITFNVTVTMKSIE